jgi:hypothetical protein
MPYRGLVPYGERDAHLFFGREADRQIITANLFSSRLTVLYGASGVGKSSVLRAAVAHHLHQDATQPVIVFNRWHDAPLAELRRDIDAEVERIRQQPAAGGDGEALVAFIQRRAEGMSGPFVVILDQFEEYFLYSADDDRSGSFAAELSRAINHPACPATFVISLREDAVTKLDRFERRIPALFDNYLRLDHLDDDGARQAIAGPLAVISAEFDPDHPYTAEPALVESVVEQVKTGKVVLGQVGRGTLPAESTPGAGSRVEAPYLQLVMTRLWDEEVARRSRILRLSTLESLGGAERIVRTHLDGVMAHLRPGEQEVAAHTFHFLVTPSGSKIALDVDTLQSFSGVPAKRIQPVVEHLSQPSLRVLRAVSPAPGEGGSARYEIFHDVLAPAIMDWRARYFARAGFARDLPLASLAAILAICVVQLIPGIPALALSLLRGVGLLLVNTVPVMQVYRWFSRYLGITTASLAGGPYAGPNLGILLGVLLSLFWYASTRWSSVTPSPNPLGAISGGQYLAYLLVVMPSVLVAFLTFLVMRSAGQLTYLLFRRFNAGYYGTYLVVCAALAVLIVLGLAGLLPPGAQISF